MRLLLTLPGAPITKKNSQQILTNRKTGKPFIAPSKQFKTYEKSCVAPCKELVDTHTDTVFPIECPVNIQCVYYMPTRRGVDLCNLIEATCDILVKHGVIKDDCCNIVFSHDGSRVFYDKEHPRAEIVITDSTEAFMHSFINKAFKDK